MFLRLPHAATAVVAGALAVVSALVWSATWVGAEEAGYRTFGQLGLGDAGAIVTAEEPAAVALDLPKGAVQPTEPGPGFHALAVHMRASGLLSLTDIAFVEVRWNEQAGARLKLRPVEGPNGELMVLWSVPDIVNGPTRGYETSDHLALWLSNFPATDSVSSGANIITVSIAGPGANALRVHVFPDSFVRLGPGPTRVTDRDARIERSGQEIHISATVVGDLEPAKWFEAAVLVLASDNTVLGSSFDWYDGGTSREIDLGLELPAGASPESLYLSVSYPAGGTPLLQLSPARVAIWDRIWDAVPWAVVVLIAVIVLWVSLSNWVGSWRRPTTVALMVGLTVAYLQLAPVSGSASAVEAPLPSLPFPSRADFAQAESALQGSGAFAEKSVGMRRTQVWWMTEGGVPSSLVVELQGGEPGWAAAEGVLIRTLDPNE